VLPGRPLLPGPRPLPRAGRPAPPTWPSTPAAACAAGHSATARSTPAKPACPARRRDTHTPNSQPGAGRCRLCQSGTRPARPHAVAAARTRHASPLPHPAATAHHQPRSGRQPRPTTAAPNASRTDLHTQTQPADLNQTARHQYKRAADSP
jgi:hypothetical protein